MPAMAGAMRSSIQITSAFTVRRVLSPSAAGGAASDALADAYADALLQQGQNPERDGVPMVIAIKDRAIVLEGAGGDITLGTIAP